jgi:phosphinothricin acetyltransferase
MNRPENGIFEIRRLRHVDWQNVKRIYEEGIATGHATFEHTPPSTFNRWLQDKINDCCLGVTVNQELAGWASVAKSSNRDVYSGVGIVNIYIAQDFRGKGIGTELFKSLIRCTEDQNIWTLEARIFPENIGSILLHKKLGFREIGIRSRIGLMSYGPFKGKWRDVLLLERRSSKI